MPLPTLTASEISLKFTEFKNVQEIGRGGFKTVFKGEVDGVPEVLKVISIPRADGSAEQLRFRDECFARVRREYSILQRCKSPFMVKVASVALQEHEMNGDFFSIYSEEFLNGPDLWKLIRAKSPLPANKRPRF